MSGTTSGPQFTFKLKTLDAGGAKAGDNKVCVKVVGKAGNTALPDHFMTILGTPTTASAIGCTTSVNAGGTATLRLRRAL